jgi:hypothetical protein
MTIDALIKDLNSEFALKDLRDLQYFLGIQVTVVLCQEKYATNLLQRVGIGQCKTVVTPLNTSKKMSIEGGTRLGEKDSMQYRSVVDALQYLTLARRDISFAVNKVCQFLHAPTTLHWMVVKIILRYVRGSLKLGIQFTPNKSTLVSAFTDAGWGLCSVLGM